MGILVRNGFIARRVVDNKHDDSERNGSSHVLLYKKTSRSLSFSLAFLTGKITLWGKVSEYATRFASFTFEFGKLIFVSSA